MSRRALALFVMVAAILSRTESAAAASEKWWDAYGRGVAAVQSRNYEAAVQPLQRALAEMPKENQSARARNGTVIYLPHFWLGVARFNLGDIDGALREWKTSEDQGAIQNTRYYSDLREWTGRAQSQKKRTSEPVAAQAKRDANAAAGRAVSAQLDALAAGGDQRDSYRAAQRRLQESLDVTSRAGGDPEEYRRAAEIADQARELFASAADEARSQKAARSATGQQPAPALAKRETTVPPGAAARSEPASTESPGSRTPQIPAVVQTPQISTPAALQKAEPTPVVSEAQARALMALQLYRRHLGEIAADHRSESELRDYARREVRESEKWQKVLAGKQSDKTIRSISDQLAGKERELQLRLRPAAAPNPGPGTAVAAVPQNPGPTLESAYRAFASGNLDEAEQQLTRILFEKESGEAHLLRGSCLYTRAMLSRRPEPLLASAVSDFHAALKLNRDLRLDRAAFSPKLVEFFDQLKRGQ